MGTTSNAARAAQLGMPWGTAQHRLRKMIMFRMMQKCGEDSCFKCGSPIETVEELSIEHKVDWLHVSPELYWDLDNLAWSHLRCNKPRPGIKVHSRNRYKKGCRCEDCTRSMSEYTAKYRAKRELRSPGWRSRSLISIG